MDAVKPRAKTLTFFKSADRIIVDGNEELRTQTKRGGPCPAARSVMSTLKTHDLTKSDGGRTVVRGVSLEVSSGEIVGLLGSERRRQDDDVLHDRRTDGAGLGRVELDGQDVTDDPMYIRARKGIGYLPAGAVDFPRADGGAEPARHSRNHGARRRDARARGFGSCWPS